MEENLVKRLEAAVARLEELSAGGFRQGVAPEDGGDAAALDPSIVAFDDLISQYVNRVTSAGEKIGGQVLDVSKIIAEAFSVEKELLVKIKQTQVSRIFSVFIQLNSLAVFVCEVVMCNKVPERMETFSFVIDTFCYVVKIVML